MTSTQVSEGGAVNDKVVCSAIMSTLNSTFSKGDTFIRPNKLRKKVCNQIPGTTWTQFKQILDQVLKDEGNGFGMDVKNESIVTTNTDNTTGSSPKKTTTLDETTTTTPSHQHNGQKVICTKNIKVPRAIALHLTRNKFLKKRNIEANTKTKFTIHGIGPASEGLPLNELVTIQITRPSLLNDADDDDDETELAAKHVKKAESVLQKMTMAFKRHPDRFTAKKAGGTLEEQELAKKAQQAAAAAHNSKRSKNKEKLPSGHVKTHQGKRKKEKFY